jgi:hypothetical protein
MLRIWRLRREIETTLNNPDLLLNYPNIQRLLENSRVNLEDIGLTSPELQKIHCYKWNNRDLES